MPDGSLTWIEVDADHFRGSIALPLFRRPEWVCDVERKGDGLLPDGVWSIYARTDRRTCAVTVKTPAGIRYFLAAGMPIRTHAEAMDELSAGLANAAQSVIADEHARDQRLAAAAGKTVEQWRLDNKLRREREARANAARQYAERDAEAMHRLAATGKLKD